MFILCYARPPRKPPTPIENVLVIRRNRLGDAVLTAQYLSSLIKARPEINITVLTNEYAAPIYLAVSPEVRVVILPEKYFYSSIGVFFHPEVRRLRSTFFDASIVASASFSSRSILLLMMFNSRFRAAVRDDVRPSPMEAFLDESVPMSALDYRFHQIYKLAAVFNLAGLRCTPSPTPYLAEGLKRHVLIFADCNRPESHIAIKTWIAFAKQIRARGFIVKLCTKIRSTKASPDIELVFCDKTDEVINAIKQSGHVVCSEGGASHLAAALGRMITVFSGVNIKHSWFPFSNECGLLEYPNLPQTITIDQMEAAFNRTCPRIIQLQPEKMQQPTFKK